MLHIAEVIFSHPTCPLISGAFRVVAIDAASDITALVRLDEDHPASPITVSWNALRHCIETAEIDRNQEFALDLPTVDADLTDTELAELCRVRAYFLPLLEVGLHTLVLDVRRRNEEIENQSLKHHVHRRTIKRHFNLYLWAGMTMYALIGERNRQPRPQKIGSKKRGPAASGPALPEVRERLEDGYRRFYLPGTNTLLAAYTFTCDECFSDQEEHPTLRQFRYVCDCLTERTASSNLKTPTGKSRDNVLGPGFRCEIDASRFQVQLVSQFGRQFMIGEATFYALIDNFSGAYIGWAITPGPPKWDIARDALLNAFTDKTQEFQRLDLPYTSDDMPVKEIPTRLTADRAELVTNKAGVIPEMGVKVEIMASMRPDRKGQIERAIGAIKNQKHFYIIPGSHVKNPGRRVDDGKSSASLTIKELERLLVEKIIDLNLEPVPLSEIPTALVDADCQSITRIGLYKWGLENRPGHYRTLSPLEVFTFLLNKADASATSVGISYKKMTFRSARLIELGYGGEAKPIRIGYTDRADQVWFYDERTCELIAAQNDRVDIRRAHATFEEASMFLKKAEEKRQKAKMANIRKQAKKAKPINKNTRQAAEEAKAVRKGLSKSAAKREMKKNRGAEALADRIQRSQRERGRFDADASTYSAEPKPIPEALVSSASSADRLRNSISNAWEQAE